MYVAMGKKLTCGRFGNKNSTRFGIPRDSYIKWLDTVIDDWLFTPEAQKMAHAALTEAKCNEKD
jgi:hypothetical protein